MSSPIKTSDLAMQLLHECEQVEALLCERMARHNLVELAEIGAGIAQAGKITCRDGKARAELVFALADYGLLRVLNIRLAARQEADHE